MLKVGGGGRIGSVRVLFTTTPGWGHIHPMVPLARAFAGRGDEVAWAATAVVAPRLEQEGFTVHAAGQSLEVSFGEAMRRFPEIQDLPPTERPNTFFPQFFGAVQAPAMLSDLLPVARAFEPALLVCDQAELAGPIVAALLGVPNVTHSFGGLIPAVRLEGAARAMAPAWEAHGLEPRPYAGTYDHLYLDIYPPSMKAADDSHVPFSQHLRPETFVTGEEVPLPPWITEEVAAPLVYVTFGTVFNSNPELAVPGRGGRHRRRALRAGGYVIGATHSACQVRGPTMPSTASAFSVWYLRTMASVLGPKTPSSAMPHPRSFSRRCAWRTSSPPSPWLRRRPGQGGHPGAFGGGAGAAVDRLFQVAGPRMPSASKPHWRWKETTTSTVFGP